MLVKYLGTEYDKDNDQWIPRSEFLENGLFRMTQPKFLNDKGSEARFYPYLNEFSPADMAYARKSFYNFNIGQITDEPSDEELISFYLEPSGEMYTIENFPTLLGFTDYGSVESYNEAQSVNLKKSVEELHKLIIETVSSRIGVFSLSKAANDPKMWAHYANNHNGLAVTFKEDHPFFQNFGLQDVSYKQEDRASFTYYKGTIRINGEFSKYLEKNESAHLSTLYSLVSKHQNNFNELERRLLYTKDKVWSDEQEKRIICPLELCEEMKGKVVTPDLNKNIPEHLLKNFPSYHEVCLKKIPFDAFDSIIFGESMNNLQRVAIINKAQSNPNLKHLQFRKADIDIYGKIIIEDL